MMAGGAAVEGRAPPRGILKTGSSGRGEEVRKKRHLQKPSVRFADKKKRTLKGGGKGERGKKSGGRVFRRRAKAS